MKYNGMIHNEGYEYAFVTESNPRIMIEFTYLVLPWQCSRRFILGINHKEMRNEWDNCCLHWLFYAGRKALRDFSTGKKQWKAIMQG